MVCFGVSLSGREQASGMGAGRRGFHPLSRSSASCGKLGKPLSAQPTAQQTGQQEGPALLHAPSLRDGPDLSDFPADLPDGPRHKVPFFVQDADFDGALTAALHLPSDAGHVHGPAAAGAQRRQRCSMLQQISANGFAVVFAIIKPQVEVPPVIEEGDEAGHHPAGSQFARGVTAPAPLVFEFVETIMPAVFKE